MNVLERWAYRLWEREGVGYEVHLTSEKERAKCIREVQKMTEGNKICNITLKLLSNGIATMQAKQSWQSVIDFHLGPEDFTWYVDHPTPTKYVESRIGWQIPSNRRPTPQSQVQEEVIKLENLLFRSLGRRCESHDYKRTGGGGAGVEMEKQGHDETTNECESRACVLARCTIYVGLIESEGILGNGAQIWPIQLLSLLSCCVCKAGSILV